MKQPINMRFDKRLLSKIDKFLKTLVPKKDRTAFMEEAAAQHLRREKRKQSQ